MPASTPVPSHLMSTEISHPPTRAGSTEPPSRPLFGPPATFSPPPSPTQLAGHPQSPTAVGSSSPQSPGGSMQTPGPSPTPPLQRWPVRLPSPMVPPPDSPTQISGPSPTPPQRSSVRSPSPTGFPVPMPLANQPPSNLSSWPQHAIDVRNYLLEELMALSETGETQGAARGWGDEWDICMRLFMEFQQQSGFPVSTKPYFAYILTDVHFISLSDRR